MMEGFHFSLRLAQTERRSKSLRHRLARQLSGEAEVGSMAGIIGLGTVTSGLAAFARGRGDGTTAKISQIGDMAK